MYYSAEIAVDHITDRLPFMSTGKLWTGERRRARFSERKGAEKAIFGGKCHHKCVWEHRRCSHRVKEKTAESPLTVRISGGSENEKIAVKNVFDHRFDHLHDHNLITIGVWRSW